MPITSSVQLRSKTRGRCGWPSSVLEIGCGLGTESINFARAGADLTVVELSQKSLELARQRFTVYGLQARFIHGNAEELDRVCCLSGEVKRKRRCAVMHLQELTCDLCSCCQKVPRCLSSIWCGRLG